MSEVWEKGLNLAIKDKTLIIDLHINHVIFFWDSHINVSDATKETNICLKGTISSVECKRWFSSKYLVFQRRKKDKDKPSCLKNKCNNEI